MVASTVRRSPCLTHLLGHLGEKQGALQLLAGQGLSPEPEGTAGKPPASLLHPKARGAAPSLAASVCLSPLGH